MRWVGALSTINASESFRIDVDRALIARFSENPDFFRLSADIEELPP